MKTMKGFMHGVNLGGWMSQCDYSRDRLDRFIAEEDFAKIAGWGLDHVRLPFDYNVVETADGSSYLEDGFARIERAVKLSRKYGLNIVLDLHKTAGFSFDAGERQSGFFEDGLLQERFFRLWEEMAKRFGNDPDHVAFELLNEVTDQQYCGKWNAIVMTCIARIRAYAPDTVILVGSYWNNHAYAVKDLDKPYDDKIVYNFHCYEPLKYTHQGATWISDPSFDIKERIRFIDSGATEEYFEQMFAEAISKAEANGTVLYCGEYGVIDRVSAEEALPWYRTICAVFDRHGIGRATWTYRGMDFEICGERMAPVIDELVRIL